MNIRIGIITAPRSGGVDTLSRTIHSMRGACDPLTKDAKFGVFCDGVDPPACEEPIDHLELRTAVELAKLRETTYIGAPNLARALRWAAQDTDIAVVSEDDLLLARTWLTRTIELLRLAQGRGVQHPVICLSHAFDLDLEKLFDQTDICTPKERLLAFVDRSWGNGMSPVVTTSETAKLLADNIDSQWEHIEPDTAIMRSCQTCHQGVATGFYTDPCFAMHMAMNSTYAPNRHVSFAETKRFRPW